MRAVSGSSTVPAPTKIWPENFFARCSITPVAPGTPPDAERPQRTPGAQGAAGAGHRRRGRPAAGSRPQRPARTRPASPRRSASSWWPATNGACARASSRSTWRPRWRARWRSSIREHAGRVGYKRAMTDARRFQLDELTIRPGTYFNPQTEVTDRGRRLARGRPRDLRHGGLRGRPSGCSSPRTPPWTSTGATSSSSASSSPTPRRRSLCRCHEDDEDEDEDDEDDDELGSRRAGSSTTGATELVSRRRERVPCHRRNTRVRRCASVRTPRRGASAKRALTQGSPAAGACARCARGSIRAMRAVRLADARPRPSRPRRARRPSGLRRATSSGRARAATARA